MKNPTISLPVNLDCENTVAEWIKAFGTMSGRRLANHLGLSGRGSAKAASSLSNYAWNKSTAIDCRRRGQIASALQYEAICDRIYQIMPESVKGW